MTFVIKATRPTSPKPHAVVDEHGSHIFAPTVVVLPNDDETIYTGLVNASGDAIHRQVKRPAGFVRFPAC